MLLEKKFKLHYRRIGAACQMPEELAPRALPGNRYIVPKSKQFNIRIIAGDDINYFICCEKSKLLYLEIITYT